MKSFITSICKCLLTLLGFSAVGCTRVEYGTPYADFEVKGKVVDADLSQPVQGLKVSAVEQGGSLEPVATGTTDAEGR
ncbi:MAG: radical SAM-associated putative lipoprotein, partial [Bacteroidetes bacterium]|nr:radical SAM-associated putative lipoprotein [Candidatus Cryptobacteroides faecavium]